MTDFTGLWTVPWYPFTTIEITEDRTLGVYRVRATIHATLKQCAEQGISSEEIYFARDPWVIIKEVMMATLDACGVPHQEAKRLVDWRRRIARGSRRETIDLRCRNGRPFFDTELINTAFSCIPPPAFSLQGSETYEPTSVICDQCSNVVHAVMEEGMLVFPVYTSTQFPTHQLYESCFTQAEQA